MSILKKVKRCSHCGAILQTENPEKEGYITSLILKKYPDGVLLCDKCFNEEKTEDNIIVLNDEFKSILKTIKEKNALVVYVIDLFSFEGGFPSEATSLLSDLDVIVVANKRDLMPKDSEDEQLISYVNHRLRVSSLKVKETILTSINSDYHIDELRKLIRANCEGRDVYFVGSSTSGKSALISEILKNFENKTNKYIVTYTFPNTSLRGFQIPITDKTYIYEVPGFPINNSLLGVLEKPIVNYIVPKKAIEDRKFNINDKVSLAIGGLAFIQQLTEEKTTVHCYASPKITIKAKRGDALNFFDSILKNGDQTNTSFKFRNLNNFDVYDFEITETGERDIGVLGLGWVQFKGNNQKFRVFVPKGVYVYTTRAKLKNVK